VGLRDYRLAAHVELRGGLEHHIAPHGVGTRTGPAARLASCGLGRTAASARPRCRPARRTGGPTPAGAANDFVAGALAADVFVGRDGGQHRNADAARQRLAASPVPSSLLMTMPATPTLPPSLRKYSTAEHTLLATYSDCRSLLTDHNHLLAHVTGNRQTEAAARPRRPKSRAARSQSPSRGSPVFRAVSKPWMMPRPPQPRPTSGPPSSMA